MLLCCCAVVCVPGLAALCWYSTTSTAWNGMELLCCLVSHKYMNEWLNRWMPICPTHFA